MSLVTTCPECQIRFIVRPEHLSAHGGKVRCGKCNHVFNAIEHLQEPNAVEVPVDSAFSTATHATSSPIYVEAIEEAPIEFPFKSTDVASEKPLNVDILERPFEEAAETSHETVSASTSRTDSLKTASSNADELLDAPRTTANVARIDESAIDEALASAAINLDTDYNASPPHATTQLDDILPPLKTKPAKRKQDKPAVRTRSYTWLWVLLSLLLMLVAVGQTAYFMRSRLAVLLPPIKPYLVLACGYVHCTIPLPKDMQLLVIDDSDLHEDVDHDGILHLTSTLINNAPYAQAYPNIELSLTNEHDTPVLRRIFTPAEYLDPQVNASNGILGGDETHINLALHVTDTAVSGYRVYLTYH